MPGERSAVITGGSRGIGRAVAVELAKAGYDIAFCSRNGGDAAAETEDLITKHGVRAFSATCDVTDYDALCAFFREAEAVLGPPYAVVPSAGVLKDRPVALMDPADWHSVIDINLTGTFNVCRAAVGGLIRRREGAIVAISSVIGVLGNAGQANYAASKAGINGLVKALAKEVARYGVRVNALAPGFIETDMLAGLTDKTRSKALERIPLGRFGSAEEVAELTGFLVSPSGGYITGQVIQIDGGLIL